jgi:biopolymer transport protein ExbD
MAVKIRKGNSGQVDFTPMIDMVFNLLIFFMVTTEFAKEERELDVTLASASEARPLTATEETVFINISRDGQYIVDNRRMAVDDLEAFLRTKHTNNPASLAVKIRPDLAGTMQPYVSALNVCTKVGIKNASLATKGEN